LEWFNLAGKRTAGEFYLHDDFYLEDGTARQPKQPVERPEQCPVPTLERVWDSPEDLIDYYMTRWHVTDELEEALRRLDPAVLIASLAERISISRSFDVEATAYSICGVIGPAAAIWVRRQVDCYHPYAQSALIRTLAQCLPETEGLELAFQAMEKVPANELADKALALGDFHSSKVLDWMESHVPTPCKDSWGRTAAVSKFSWPRAGSWLDRGRPLSLVALDALNACWHYDSPYLQQVRPKLLSPAPVSIMTESLERYAVLDPVPRVQRAVEAIIGHWPEICPNTSSN
jgi:hypothetical protein